MADKIDETIKEIVIKHGIAVGRDDPILILQTINEQLMKESTAAQQANLDAFKSELEEIAYRWGEDAKNKAERTLNAAMTASKDIITDSIKENSKVIADVVKKQIEKTINQELKPSIRGAIIASFMNLVAAGITVLVAGLILWSSW